MNGLRAVLYFIIPLFFNLVLFALLLRMGLRFFKISFVNPIAMVIYRLTDPLLYLLRFIPGCHYRPGQRFDWQAFIILILIDCCKIIVIGLLVYGLLLPWTLILLCLIADLIIQSCNLLFFLILIRVIMSWTNPYSDHPINPLIIKFTEPALRLGRRLVPNVSGFDFSPFIVGLLLIIINLFISNSLPVRLL